MTSEVLTFQADPDPCAVLSCDRRGSHIAVCRVDRCPHTWSRVAREDRARRDLADEEARAGG